MIWAICIAYSIVAVLLSRVFPVLGALGVLCIPFLKINFDQNAWLRKRVELGKYLMKHGYCIHYSKESAVKDPKAFCARAGRINCADCIAEVLGIGVKDILD